MSMGALGLTMEEIQRVIAEASERTPDIGPDGADMGDPEYVTAYMLNIVIPLLQYNNLRIEEQLLSIGIRIPTKEQIQEAIMQQMAQRGGMEAGDEPDEEYSDMVRAIGMGRAADGDDGPTAPDTSATDAQEHDANERGRDTT